MKTLLTIGMIGNLMDTISTLILYYKYGFTEANPIMDKLLEFPVLFVLVKVVTITLLSLFLWKRREDKHAKLLSWILAIVYGGIAIYYVVFFMILRGMI